MPFLVDVTQFGNILLRLGRAGYRSEPVTADSTTDKITLNNHGLANGTAVTFGGTLPGGLSANTVYFVVKSTTNDFKVATAPGGPAIDLTSNGSAVTLTQDNPFQPPSVINPDDPARAATLFHVGTENWLAAINHFKNSVTLYSLAPDGTAKIQRTLEIGRAHV